MTKEEIRQLKMYYEIPQLITEEMLTIRNCEEQMNTVTLSSSQISGMPAAHGKPSDATSNAVLLNANAEFEKEIRLCSQRIAYYRDLQSRIRGFLNSLDITDLRIIQLKYLGPQDIHKRRKWRSPNWDMVSDAVGYSKSQVFNRLHSVFSQYPLKDWTKSD